MAVVLPNRGLIVVPAPDEGNLNLLRSVFPEMKYLMLSDGPVIALPHIVDALRLLQNMGIDTTGCELFNYYYTPPSHPQGYTPFWWQLETASFLSSNYRAYCTSTPRTGKTLSTCMAIDCLQKLGERAALVVAPLTVAANGEWVNSFKEWFPNKKVVFAHKDREAELATPADVYVINPDGMKIMEKRLVDMVQQGMITIIAFDELTEYSDPRSQRYKAAKNICSSCRYVWGLTGTPGGPEKVYGQIKLLTPQNVPRSFPQWREQTMYQATPFKWLPAVGHEEKIKEAMSPCIRFDKDQLMTIPIPQVVSDYVPLSAEQEELSNALIQQLQVLVDSKEINAINASSLATKLLQVSGGMVRTQDGDAMMINAQPKLDRLEYYLRRTPHKKVVFSNFVAINNMLVEKIREMGFTCEKIDGSVNGVARSTLINEFQNGETPHVLVCHPRTAAYGIELSRADHIICYGPPMSGTFVYQQMFERLSSTKQQADETFVVHLMAGKQDKISFDNLSKGVEIDRNIVDIFTRNLLDETSIN